MTSSDVKGGEKMETYHGSQIPRYMANPVEFEGALKSTGSCWERWLWMATKLPGKGNLYVTSREETTAIRFPDEMTEEEIVRYWNACGFEVMPFLETVTIKMYGKDAETMRGWSYLYSKYNRCDAIRTLLALLTKVITWTPRMREDPAGETMFMQQLGVKRAPRYQK